MAKFLRPHRAVVVEGGDSIQRLSEKSRGIQSLVPLLFTDQMFILKSEKQILL
jgi:hypothetical protein